MSYASRRRPSTRRANGRGAPPRGGGGNPTLIVVAILLLGGVIAGVVVLGGRKDKGPPAAPPAELTAGTQVKRDAPAAPARPTRMPPPPLSEGVKELARGVAAAIDADRQRGDALYEEAMKAKDQGDTDLWQAKLKEAARHFNAIKDRWNNEIIDAIMLEIPASSDWDAEEVANHYLGKEGQLIAKALERLAYIKKQVRLDGDE